MFTTSLSRWLGHARVFSALVAATISAVLVLQPALARADHTAPLKISLSKFKCIDETNDGPGDDEIYIIVFVADLRTLPPVGFPKMMTFKTRTYEDVDRGFRHPNMQVWDVDGSLDWIDNRNDVLILAGIMEHDSARTSAVKALVQAGVSANLLNYVNNGLNRDTIVSNLRSDMDGFLVGAAAQGAAANIPFSNGDERIGRTQELRLTAGELQSARGGTTVTKTLEYRGDGGFYRLYFDITNH